jgi:alpha-galactosidase
MPGMRAWLIPVLTILIGCASSRESVHHAVSFYDFAPAPPMGWNSYDSFGDSVTEAEVRDNANYMRDHLISHGWKYIVIDYRWYDPGAHSSDLKDRVDAQLSMDQFGRLTPAENRFPSGFKKLADDLHGMGMKFGIHVMRGIPRNAVQANSPIEGSKFIYN